MKGNYGTMGSYLKSSLASAKTLFAFRKFPSPKQSLRSRANFDFYVFKSFKMLNMMGKNGERNADPHTLFLISQNEDLPEEERERAQQGLRELSAGSVYVPPPTVLVMPSQERARCLETSENTQDDEPRKKPNNSPVDANKGRRKPRVAKNRPRKPVEIPANVEIIVVSSDSENGSSPVKLAVRKSHVRRRIYHPQNHTSEAWRCPVSTCPRHDPKFGFQNNAYVERHIRNRHANDFVYPCISGCSIAFRNGRDWERHHRDFHADEVGE